MTLMSYYSMSQCRGSVSGGQDGVGRSWEELRKRKLWLGIICGIIWEKKSIFNNKVVYMIFAQKNAAVVRDYCEYLAASHSTNILKKILFELSPWQIDIWYWDPSSALHGKRNLLWRKGDFPGSIGPTSLEKLRTT